MKTSTLVVAAVVTTILVSSIAQAQIRHVDDDAALGGDGLSWGTAYRFLQDALANVAPGTETRVAQGVYKPDRDNANPAGTGDREETFQLLDGVALRAGSRVYRIEAGTNEGGWQ